MNTKLPALLLFPILGCAAMFMHAPAAVKNAKAQKPAKARRTLSFAAYRKWQVVNPQPHAVPGPVAALCAAPMPAQQRERSPHEGKFIRVYINATARRAMLHQKTPRFPRGSIVVKEKLATPTSKTAELLTAMIKREAGFDAANGDWEYLVLNGSGTKVQQRGKLVNCQNCHEPQRATDFVFRDYLPAEVEQKLR